MTLEEKPTDWMQHSGRQPLQNPPRGATFEFPRLTKARSRRKQKKKRKTKRKMKKRKRRMKRKT